MSEPARPPTDLATRYGAPAPWRRQVLVIAVAALGVVFLAWVGWVAWVHGTPAAESELIGYDVQSDSATVAHVDVQLEDAVLEDGVAVSCRVRAAAEDHTTVGELAFTPTQGRNDITVRTERRATSIELIGCTTPDQGRPR